MATCTVILPRLLNAKLSVPYWLVASSLDARKVNVEDAKITKNGISVPTLRLMRDIEPGTELVRLTKSKATDKIVPDESAVPNASEEEDEEEDEESESEEPSEPAPKRARGSGARGRGGPRSRGKRTGRK